MNFDYQSQIISELNHITPLEQQRVLEFVRSLKPPLQGMSGNILRRHFGSISQEDAQRMMSAVSLDCGQVNPNEW